MKKRDGGVDEERVTREARTDEPVHRLEEASAGDHPEKLGAEVERDLEDDGD